MTERPLVRFSGGQATVTLYPSTGAGAAVAVKTYRPEASDLGFRAEVAGLEVLASIARTVPATDGWSAGSVEVLDVDERARRITMSVAKGVQLSAAPVAGRELDAVCAVVHDVLVAYWAESGTIFGDLTLDNVLVDSDRRQVVCIDPGMPRDAWRCEGVPNAYWPSSRDVGYLIYSACTGLLRRPLIAPGRNTSLAWRLATAWSPPDQEQFRGEVMGCVDAHLQRLRSSRTRRVRRRLVHRVTRARIRRSAPPGWVI